MTKRFIRDLTGHRFGRLLVQGFIPDDSRTSRWIALCDCGTQREVDSHSLVAGRTLSCGCFGKEQRAAAHTTHGHGGRGPARSRAYRIWANMMDRCEWGGNVESYLQYGARGIRVCERWHKFEPFLADMGAPPARMSLDRIDGSGNYEPSNCRWATSREQNLNRSNTVRVVYAGKIRDVARLCEELGISRVAVRSRAIRRGNNYASALRSMGHDATELPA
jgi:hypothetical protein